MIPGIIYRLDVLNFDGDMVRCDISDNETLIPDDETPAIYLLLGSGDPLHISVINNDEDKFTAIRAKQATIQILSGSGVDITTFADGPDSRFSVAITFDPEAAALTMFRGFLVTSELEQYFLPDPNIVTLVATDHLGTLKDIPWTTDEGDNPQGKFKIGVIIAQCLKKTGLALPISVINNLRHGTGVYVNTNIEFSAADSTITLPGTYDFFYVGQTIVIDSALNDMTTTVIELVSNTEIKVSGTLVDESATIYNVTFTDPTSGIHIYDVAYLDALTFEEEIGVSINCYEVLERILGESCFLTQYNGAWWICRIPEYAGGFPFYVASYDIDGAYQSITEATGINKSIGVIEDYRFINRDNLLRLERPKWFAKETWKYEYPDEILCNIDYNRGEDIIPPDLTAPTFRSTSTFECWTLYKQIPPVTLDNTAYIERNFTYGYEESRYVVIDISPSDGYYYLESQQIPVDAGDRFDFSVDKRWEGQVETGSGFVRVLTAQIRLYGEDGTRWTLHAGNSSDPITAWVQSAADFSTDNQYFYNEFDASQDDTEWRTAGFWAGATCPDIPVSGYITAVLVANLKTSSFRTLFSNINFRYIPKINGTYAVVTGETEKVMRTETGYLDIRDKTIYIKDSPKQLFKGSILLLVGGVYKLSRRWYPAQMFALGDPGAGQFVKPIGWHQVYGAWNQVNNTLRKFSSSVLGIGAAWPDIIHSYAITDADANTTYRCFLLISQDMNLKSCQSNMTFVEVYRSDIEQDYTSDHEFKFITK